MNSLDLAWLAGFLEGEGYFVIYKQAKRTKAQVHLGAHSTDEDVINRAARIMDGRRYGPYKPSRATGPIQGKKMRHVVQLYGKKAQALATQLLPLMGERRQVKIRELLSIDVADGPERHNPSGRWMPVSPQLAFPFMQA